MESNDNGSVVKTKLYPFCPDIKYTINSELRRDHWHHHHHHHQQQLRGQRTKCDHWIITTSSYKSMWWTEPAEVETQPI